MMRLSLNKNTGGASRLTSAALLVRLGRPDRATSSRRQHLAELLRKPLRRRRFGGRPRPARRERRLKPRALGVAAVDEVGADGEGRGVGRVAEGVRAAGWDVEQLARLPKHSR